ncbi:phosphoglycerate kinase [Pontimonas salivibrio]|uniref:Phosphoglycerate kinase n=1 Tax=Pontimonas salivibrio TaxID=1159327 RepID=A0A2L2BQS5_9MICO|nr:phosphoglycerate kinase [Pontimonas salivibrio]AVG24025.1 phosphoglycerate kinase [Pontimonas salivibrio]
MGLRGIDTLGSLEGLVVGVRLDLNTPLKDGEITDDGRVHAALPTLRELAARGAKMVVMSHLGRPDGKPDEKYSLAAVAKRLQELWSGSVKAVSQVSGAEVQSALSEVAAGDIVLVENLRFDARETSKDTEERRAFAEELAAPLDCVVSDGFGVVHRPQASVVELVEAKPSSAGLLIEAEVKVLEALRSNPERPYTVVLGGSKVSDKLGVIDALLPVVDKLVIGGGMVFTLLQAQGHATGSSLLEADQIETVKGYLSRASELGVDIVLPTDIVMAESFAADAPSTVLPIDQLESGPAGKNAIGLDIGPDSAQHFAEIIASSRTVFWNGPMGVFEFDAFAHGTRAVAAALTEVAGLSVVGGGDSAAAVRRLGFDDDQFGHISTGGGASLEFLEGKTLPGLKVLGW